MNHQSTDDRDKELDGLDDELKEPHIHMPDELDEADGTMCFLNDGRRCGSTCTAYNWEMQDRPAPNQCVILYHLGALASGAIGFIHSLRDQQRAQEDKSRTEAADQGVPKI